jgi:hypothetical protein
MFLSIPPTSEIHGKEAGVVERVRFAEHFSQLVKYPATLDTAR